jgi:hypothetical protein
VTGKPLLRVCSDVVSQQVGDGLVLLNLRTGVYWGLNRTGAVVWHALQQQSSFEGICQEIESKFEASKEDVSATVRALMDELAGENLLVPAAPGETVTSGAPQGAGAKMAGRPNKGK